METKFKVSLFHNEIRMVKSRFSQISMVKLSYQQILMGTDKARITKKSTATDNWYTLNLRSEYQFSRISQIFPKVQNPRKVNMSKLILPMEIIKMTRNKNWSMAKLRKCFRIKNILPLICHLELTCLCSRKLKPLSLPTGRSTRCTRPASKSPKGITQVC